MAHKEYLRRNLNHASSVGAVAAIRVAQERIEAMKRKPKWLVDALHSARERAEKLPKEMAAWRDCAPDAPVYVKK